MKVLIKTFLCKIIHFFYDGLHYEDLYQNSFSSVFKLFFVQKICRINSNVNWQVHHSSSVLSPENVKRGKNFRSNSKNCHIDGRNGIILGENVWIGPSVKIISQNHNLSKYSEYIKGDPIIIGDNCWIGAGAISLPGVQLGNHTVVAAGSVVTKIFPSTDQLLAGNPAIIKKKIPPYSNEF